MTRLKSDRKLQLVVAGAGLVAVLAAGWLLLVSPTRTEATSLATDVQVKQAELAQKQAELARPSAAVKVRASDLFRLTKALPDQNDMSAILLDVNRLAAANKLAFRSVTPSTPVAGAGSLALPLSVSVQGRFSSVSKFLADLRKTVRVRDGLLDARGRTYSITQIDLGAPDEAEFPVVKAIVTVNAHSFSPPPPATAPTTPTTPTTPSADGTVAAGATP